MNPYREADLQTYVERNFMQLATWGLPCAFPVRLLGAQVPCANGIIDVLGVLGYLPVIVELKAVTVTEKVAGQILRYRAAVEDTFMQQCCDLAYDLGYWTEIELGVNPAMCVVIAPQYERSAVDALCGCAWLLQAELIADGSFAIQTFTDGRRHTALSQSRLATLLAPVVREYVGWRLGSAIAARHRLASGITLPFAEPTTPEANS